MRPLIIPVMLCLLSACAGSHFEVALDGERNAAIGEVLDVHSAAIEGCYVRALAMNDSLGGNIVLRALVMPDGHAYVPAARVSDPQLVPVATCMLRQLQHWSFPASEDAEYVSIPLTLKAVRGKRPSVRLLDPGQTLRATSVLAGPLPLPHSVPAEGV